MPTSLNELSAPPEEVFVLGELPRGPCVAIVGSRSATEPASRYAFELSASLAAAGVAIISGGAEGVDTAAHRGALHAQATTVVVAPSSFDHPFPHENATLFRQVVEQGGAFLSRYREGRRPHRARFFARNADLVALSHAVIIVEAGLRSGARNAAKWARTLGRPLWVVPSPPWNAQGLGCIAELRLGARALMSPKDVLRSLSERRLHPIAPSPTALQLPLLDIADSDRQQRRTARTRAGRRADVPSGRTVATTAAASRCGLGEHAESLLDALADGPCWLDELVLRTRLDVPALQELILTLTLKGVLASDPSGRLYVVSA